AEPLAATMVEGLLKSRRQGGGFSYLIGTSLDPKQRMPDHAMSFMTAAVAESLERARAARLAGPDQLLDDALACLEAAGNDDGTFEYTLVSDVALRGSRKRDRIGSSGRAPLCAWVLAQAGRRRGDAVAAALDRFLENVDSLVHERGKTLMHCGPEG